MVVAVTHTKIATLPDEPGAEVNKAEWNDAHVIVGLGTAAEANTGDFDAVGAATAAVAVHEAAGDPHPQYLTAAEGDALFLTSAEGNAVYEALGAVATHAAAADPHTGYQKESEKDAASGYAGLSAASKLAGAQQTYGSAVNTACEGNDARLSDSRAPNGAAGGDLAGTYPNPTVGTAKVTLAKMENRATQTFIGRNTAATGVPEELSVATAKTMLSLTGTNSGDQTITLTGDVTGAGTGSFAATIAANAVTDAKFRQGVARSVVGVTGNATANTADIQGTTDQVMRINGAGTAAAFGAIDLSKAAAATGVLQAASFPALTGDVTTVAGALATTIGAGKVTRVMLEATGKNWQYLGSATGAAGTVGPVIWTGTFLDYYFEYVITGYNGGTPVGRVLIGAASISTTALTNGNALITDVAAKDATSVSKPGLPLAVTLSNIARCGVGFIQGASGSFKQIVVEGMNGNPAVATSPTKFSGRSFFSDLGTNLVLQRIQLTVYDTLIAVAVSAQTFTTGTYIRIWGRNND